MKARSALLLVLLLLAGGFAPPGATAQDDGTLGDVRRDPDGAAGDFANRTASEETNNSIIRVFRESWEGADSIEGAGWTQQVLNASAGGHFRRVHQEKDNPLPPPKRSPISTRNGNHAVTVMGPEGTYAPRTDARLVSPPIDLRYVRGASAATSALHDGNASGQALRDLHAAYLTAVDRLGTSLAPAAVLGPFHYLFTTPPGGVRSAPGPDVGVGSTVRWSDVEENEDYKNRVEPVTSEEGVYIRDGDVHFPNPVNDRAGASYVNLTFWHRFDIATVSDLPYEVDGAYLEVRQRRPDGTWSDDDWTPLRPDAVFNEGHANPSSTHHGATTGYRTMGYNGHVDGGRTAAFVGDSDGLVASTFNLNRYAGTEIQIAFRFVSGQYTVNDLGWVIDDVSVWANVYGRDVGVREVLTPTANDRVSEAAAFRPTAVVKNYGYLNLTDVAVTFRVTDATDDSRVLYQNTQRIPRIDSQVSVEVAADRLFSPPKAGDYNLVVNATYFQPPDDPATTNASRRPESNPNDSNNRRVVPFQVHTVADARVSVEVDPDTLQTNVGEDKRYTVRVENKGNVPLSGAVIVEAQRVGRTDLTALAPATRLTRDAVTRDELPYGKDLTALGTEDNEWTQAYEWTEGLDEAGVYRLNVTFATEHGNFTASTLAYVRATSAPYYYEGFDEDPELPFPNASVYNHRLSAEAFQQRRTFEGSVQSVLLTFPPEPVTPVHAWYGRGDDGQVGTRSYAERVNDETGLRGVYPFAADTLRDAAGNVEPDAVGSTRDTNAVDHYWLVRDLDLTAVGDAESINLTFWHTGSFNWSGRPVADYPNASRSRGLVEVMPSRYVLVTGPEAEAGVPQAYNGTGNPLVDRRGTIVEAVQETQVAVDQFPRVLATYDDAFSWRRETVDLTPWRGQVVTLRFHLETTAARTQVNATTDQDRLAPWVVDNVRVDARHESGRVETLFADDGEGDEWRNWSVHRGVRVDDGVLAVIEGRGWAHRAAERASPTGWHVATVERTESGAPQESRALRWGNPEDVSPERYPDDVTLSVLRTPPLDLSNARNPVLTFLHNHSFQVERDGGTLHFMDGGSVWIVGVDEAGREVLRELLVPDGGYRGTLASWYTDTETRQCQPTMENVAWWCTALRHYPNRANAFVGQSGVPLDAVGDSQWERAVLPLGNYSGAEHGDLRFVIEFHAVNQNTTGDAHGWLIDEVQVVERDLANDVALNRIISPTGDGPVGPGLRVPVAVEVENRGLYSQSGVRLHYRVRNATGHTIYGPHAAVTDEARAIAGLLDASDPVKNRTVVFTTDWRTPVKEGRYVLEAWTNLSGSLPGHAYADDNPFNDVLRREIEVREVRSVRLLPNTEQPDSAVITPYVAAPDVPRTLTVVVENRGTLPEVFDEAHGNAGEFRVDVTVTDEAGTVVFDESQRIRLLNPGQRLEVSFPNGWTPNASGVYRLTATLHHGNETVTGAEGDNVRFLRYMVFNRYLPLPGETVHDALKPESDAWQGASDGWVFGGDGYPARADAVLELAEPLNLRSIRNAFLTVNHTYGFEAGYDGGVMEVSVDGGRTWRAVPPVTPTSGGDEASRYPGELTTASPLVEDPLVAEGAFTGASGGAVTSLFDLGAVPELTRRATLFNDTFNSSETPRQHQGAWATQNLSFVPAPPGGDNVAWYSGRIAAKRDCRVTDPGNGSSDCDAPGGYDTAKYLNTTLTVPSDARALRVEFWDWRGVGATARYVGRIQEPNEVEVRVTCLDCDRPTSFALQRFDVDGYDNNYRGWTRNAFSLQEGAVAALAGHSVNLTFVHHTASGRPLLANVDIWSTDYLSPHVGWFVDDVRVTIGKTGGDTVTHHDPVGYASKADAMAGPFAWDGAWRSVKYESGTPTLTQQLGHLLWDVRAKKSGANRLWGEPIWNYTTTGGDRHASALGPTTEAPERAGGARLVTPVDLRAAVGNATLTFNQSYDFRARIDGTNRTALSGGAVEVSLDDGATWIPLLPSDAAVLKGRYRPFYNPAGRPDLAAHNTVAGRGGDLESDSALGPGGRGFTGKLAWHQVAFDLSPYAGQRVLVAFHAFFGTHLDDRRSEAEYWHVDDVRVDADVIDGKEARLRLRAATDATRDDAGWRVHGVEMVGVKHLVNAGVRVLEPAEGATVEAGPVPVTVEVANKGQAALDVNVTLRVVGGGEDLTWRENGIRVPAEGSVLLTRLGGRDLVFEAREGLVYDIEAKLTHPREGEEAILDDNFAARRVDRVVDDGPLAVEGLTVTPNHVEPGDAGAMEIAATVENRGFTPSFLSRLNATLVDAATGASVLTLTRSDLDEDPGPRFDEAFQQKRFTWRLSGADVGALPHGLYRLNVTAVKSDGDVEVARSAVAPVFLGESHFKRHAFHEAVDNETLTRFGTPWRASGTLEWRVHTRDANHTYPAALGIGPSGMAGSDAGTPARRGALTLERPIDLEPLQPTPVLRFYTRYDIPVNTSDAAVLVAYRTGDDASCGGFAYARAGMNGTTPGFFQNEWVPVVIPLTGGLAPPADATGLCVQFQGTTKEGEGRWGGWYVDDVTVAPYHVTLGPDAAVPITDDVDKVFRLSVTNHGTFNDTYSFALVNERGNPVHVPRGWTVEVLGPDGAPLDRLRLLPGETATVGVRVRIPVQEAGGISGGAPLAVTAISETHQWIRDTATLDLQYDYLLRANLAAWGLEVDDADLPANTPRTVVATVANTGARDAVGVGVEIVDTMPPRFGQRPVQLTRVDGKPLPALTIPAGGVRTVVAMWTPATSGPHNLTLRLDPGDALVEALEDDNALTKAFPIDEARFPDLDVVLDVSDESPREGSLVQVNATITNRGGAPATGVQVHLRVGVTDLLPGDPPHLLPRAIPPGESVRLEATWRAAFPGEYRVFAKALPLSGALERVETQEDNLAVMPLTVRTQGLQVDAPDAALQLAEGAVGHATVRVQNHGGADDLVDLHVSTQGGLAAHATRDGSVAGRLALPDGGDANVTVEVRVPARTEAGTYLVNLTARSVNTSQVEVVTVPVTVEATHGVDATAPAVDLKPGRRNVTVEVANRGNAPARVTLEAVGLPAEWTISAAPLDLAPFGSGRATLILNIPTNAATGVRDLRVRAVAGPAADEAPLRVNVLEREVVTIHLSPETLEVRPGEEVALEATVENVGNGPAYVDLDALLPAGWRGGLDRPQARLEEGASTTLPLALRVPANATAGAHSVAAVAEGREESFRGDATLTVGVPDLTLESVETTPRVNAMEGDTVRYTVTVRNAGGIGVEDVGVALYIDDLLRGYETVGALAAGERATVEFNWTAEAGEHVVLATADPRADVVESDEEDNARLVVVPVGGDGAAFAQVERAVPAPWSLLLIAAAAAAVALRPSSHRGGRGPGEGRR